MTSEAVSVAPSTVHGSLGTSWKVTSAGTARKSTGNKGGENERAIRSWRLKTGDGGPQMSIATPSIHSGAKKRRPSRWSRWRWVRNRSRCRMPRPARSSPTPRAPVPASKTRVAPFSSVTSTHEVLPPHCTVSGPGVGTEPRQPQIFSRTALLPPPEVDDPDELVLVREERDRGNADLALLPVGVRDLQTLVRRAPLVESDPGRALLERDRIVLDERTRRVLAGELVDGHLAGLGECDLQRFLCCLVEEDKPAAVVDDDRRRREVGDELAREDEDEVLLALRRFCHGRSVRPHERGYTVRPAGA